MRIVTLVLITSFIGLGCASNHYGYEESAWRGLEDTEREAIQVQALDRKLELEEEYRERQFVYRPHNVYLGSRSNEY
jgi:hypothetical protein